MEKTMKLFFSVLALFCLLPGIASSQSQNNKITVNNLYGLKIDSAAISLKCRSIPFLAAPSYKRGKTVRLFENGSIETIPVGSPAKTLYLLGMINDGWDNGLSHWEKHPELLDVRDDQIQIGSNIGEIEILYEDNTKDRIPAIIGFTAWFFNQWKYPSHDAGKAIREPFASRPEYMNVFRDALQLKEEGEYMEWGEGYRSYYLAVTPRQKSIRSITIHDNESIRGRTLISGITLELPKGVKPSSGLKAFGRQVIDKTDAQPAFASDKFPDYAPKLKVLSDILYTSIDDLPPKVDLISFPKNFRGTSIRFLSDKVEGNMLSNIWTANLVNIDEKFDGKTGFFYETGINSPLYGGYQGIGTWAPAGVYRQAYSRTTDHYVRLALRCIDNPERINRFVDFCDKWLYYYRPDHNPANGPDNPDLDITRYPADAPPHWSFVMNIPWQIPHQINEIHGCEEMEGHASTIVVRWYAWKISGRPTSDQMTLPRSDVYNKSRWQSSKDAADFICWLLDYTGRDVVYSEGEFTGWANRSGNFSQIPRNMSTETDMIKIRENYANSDMYEVYASYASMTALNCSAEMADAMGEKELAQKYREYASRIRTGMIRLLALGPNHNRMWRVARNSILPSLQDCLVQAWFSLYNEGLDPLHMDKDMTPITQNTLNRQLNEKYGDAPVLAMGYGIGWLAHSALVMDRMDNAGRLLTNIARYTYDKNMDYADPDRGIDWRQWLWIIPEGTNIMPDGRWYRISDLSNGANQGPAMNALEICAGIDDSSSERVRLLPRIPDPLTGLEVSDCRAMIRNASDNAEARINYTYHRNKSFHLASDQSLPALDIRFGPYTDRVQADKVMKAITSSGAETRFETSGTYRGKTAFWVWAENMKNIRKYDLTVEGL